MGEINGSDMRRTMTNRGRQKVRGVKKRGGAGGADGEKELQIDRQTDSSGD